MTVAKIMIVEDNTTVALDCRACLESLGYEVTSIEASGEEAIAQVEVKQPDAVLMDIHLRDDIDGIEVAERIYSRFAIPVIFLSAYSDQNLLERAKCVGAFGYLIKPFEERELYATLEMALYKAKTEKERKQIEARLQQVQKVELMGTIAGGFAHQFNNALTVVNGNVDLIGMKIPGDEDVASYSQEIKESVARMSRLTAQFLAYGRGGKYQVERLSLSSFIRDALPLIRPALTSLVELKTDLGVDLYDLEADPTQLQMVFSAVLLNASEALEDKGRISIRCSNSDIIETQGGREKFPGLKPGKYACLKITDNGKGMDAETRKHIFEPFFTTKFLGRGLGMAAVYGIVKNHAGGIAVESEPGSGTTVEICLPAAPGQVRKQAEKTPVINLEKGHATILIVEDEAAVMRVCRTILTRLGYHVLTAETGEEAINLVKSSAGKIDLVLLDIMLPDINADIVYPLLMEACPDLKVIVYSGYTVDGPSQEILDAGAQGFIQKPFTIAEMSGKLKQVLDGDYLAIP